MSDPANQIKVLNRWVARVVPLILVAIVGYVTWVVTVSICVYYLIYPHDDDLPSARPGAAAAILAIYYLFFLIIATTYFRLLGVVWTNPGFVERSAQYHTHKADIKRRGDHVRGLEEKKVFRNGDVVNTSYSSTLATNSPADSDQRPGLEDFIKRDVFVCQGDGRPIFCSTCLNWKPDRSHHCREVDRCVRKMDHFCPWVGGIVSETSFKFFVQFVGWTALFCIFVLITVAIFLAEYAERKNAVKVHWVVTVGLAGLFALFTLGMFGSSMQFVLLNTTTIENLSRKSIVMQLAVHMPIPPETPPSFPTVTFSTAVVRPGSEAPAGALKTFAILHTKPGDNIWDLGAFGNFKEVMGERWFDWFLPLKYSPCTNHDRDESQFALGPVVQRLKKESGITPAVIEKPHRRRRRKHRRRHSQRE